MLLRSISAHYEIIGANLIHCRNVSHSQTIPVFPIKEQLIHLSSWSRGGGDTIHFRHQGAIMIHLSSWSMGWGGGGGIFRGKQRGDQSSLTGLQGSKAVLYCENEQKVFFVNVQHILIFGKILFTSNIPHNFQLLRVAANFKGGVNRKRRWI